MTEQSANLISIVIPYYNAQRSVKEIYDSICETVVPVLPAFEIIIVDDGSDMSPNELQSDTIAAAPFLDYEKLPENKGQSFATAKGILRSKGKLIITLDDDLIYDASLITAMIKQYRDDELEVLYGIRKSNAQHSFFRQILFNLIKQVIFCFRKRKVSSIRVFNENIRTVIEPYYQHRNFVLDKLVHKRFSRVGYQEIDVASIGKSRYDFKKLMIVSWNVLRFRS